VAGELTDLACEVALALKVEGVGDVEPAFDKRLAGFN
jgi:hypothetical protein